jgi:hypothetical protein
MCACESLKELTEVGVSMNDFGDEFMVDEREWSTNGHCDLDIGHNTSFFSIRKSLRHFSRASSQHITIWVCRLAI